MRSFQHDGFTWTVETAGGFQHFPHPSAQVWFACCDTDQRVFGRVIWLDGGLSRLSDTQLASALGIALQRASLDNQAFIFHS